MNARVPMPNPTHPTRTEADVAAHDHDRPFVLTAIALFVVMMAVALLGCAPKHTALVVVPYCSMPWAHCVGCDSGACEGAQEQWWCCDPEGGCAPVDYATDCHTGPGGWLAYCEFGQSTEQSTPDGEGWECVG